nr:MAG TPA: hypothetical protein [Caudoviricetes sp.]
MFCFVVHKKSGLTFADQQGIARNPTTKLLVKPHDATYLVHLVALETGDFC